MNLIKKLTGMLFIITIAAPGLLRAQESDQNHSLKPGARALQFQITDDAILESFSGSVLSYKWHHTASRANRIGISLNGQYQERNADFNDRNNDNSIYNLDLFVKFSWLHYINPDDDVKFYYGYGPEITAGYNKTQNDANNSSDQSRKKTDLGAGAFGYVGVEWFFQQSMSVHAEYQTSVNFLHSKESTNNSRTKSTTNVLRIGGDGVLFGISVYF